MEVKVAVFPDDPATADDDGFSQPSARSFDASQLDAEEKNIGQIQTLRSRATNIEPPTCNYGIASFTENCQFVIVPVTSVRQLRPAFDYLDERDVAITRDRVEEKLMRANARGDYNNSIDKDAADAGGDKGKDVALLQVNFKRRESERAAERRRNSHATMKEKEEAEPWMELQFHSVKSTESKDRLKQIFSGAAPEDDHNKDNDIEDEDMAIAGLSRSSGKKEDAKEMFTAQVGSDYKSLFEAHTKGSRLDLAAKCTLTAEETSSRALKVIATNAAVIQVIAYARLVTFAEIVRLVGRQRPTKDVLNAMRVGGYCLRGCWVAKKGIKELRRLGSITERYDACRNIILGLFREKRVVTVKEAEDCIGRPLLISEGAVRSVLREVGEQKTSSGWELKFEDDRQFEMMYSSIVRTQEVDWENRLAKSRDVVARIQRQIQRVALR